jgi:hypothetical protein
MKTYKATSRTEAYKILDSMPRIAGGCWAVYSLPFAVDQFRVSWFPYEDYGY